MQQLDTVHVWYIDKKELDRETRKLKLLTMYKACHRQNYKDGLYMKKKIGGGGLISVEDAVNINVDSFIK